MLHTPTNNKAYLPRHPAKGLIKIENDFVASLSSQREEFFLLLLSFDSNFNFFIIHKIRYRAA